MEGSNICPLKLAQTDTSSSLAPVVYHCHHFQHYYTQVIDFILSDSFWWLLIFLSCLRVYHLRFVWVWLVFSVPSQEKECLLNDLFCVKLDKPYLWFVIWYRDLIDTLYYGCGWCAWQHASSCRLLARAVSYSWYKAVVVVGLCLAGRIEYLTFCSLPLSRLQICQLSARAVSYRRAFVDPRRKVAARQTPRRSVT